MYRMAADILSDTQIPFHALIPLIEQTAAKLRTLTPREAQTGPAQRGDTNVINHQLHVLAEPTQNALFSPEERTQVYQLLTQLILHADYE